MSFIKHPIISDLAVAIIIVANSIAWIIPTSAAPLAVVMIISLGCLLLNNCKAMLKPGILFLVLFCIFFFIESFFTQAHNNPYVEKYLFEFIILGVGGLMASQALFSPIKVIKIISVLSIIVLPFLSMMDFTINNATDYGHWMGLSYGCVKYVIALCLILFFIKEKSRLLKLFFCVSLIGYISLFMTMASRGAVLAVLVAIILFYMINHNYKLSKFLYVSIAIVILIGVFWDFIIPLILESLAANDLHFYAFEKIALREATDSLSNGRIEIIEDAITYFKQSPIIGHGVAIYEYFNNRYVHNIFVQLLIEGGLVLFIVITWFIIKAFILAFRKTLSLEQRYFIAFLIASSIIELLFSSYLWRTQYFWFLVGYAMRFKLKKFIIVSPGVV